MKKSKFLRVNFRDIAKGILTSIIGAVITGGYQAIESGNLDFKSIAISAGIAGLSYVGKNVLENSDGKLLMKEIEKKARR
ncbi:MAG: hypothetical protein WC451_05555 [Patescibacteria group bacterium]|jgi:uncharacterized membrane protein